MESESSFSDEPVYVEEGMLTGVFCALLAMSPVSFPILYKFAYEIGRSLFG